MKLQSDLAQRASRSLSWNVPANLLSQMLSLGRSIALARLLPVEVFGVYVYASSIIGVGVGFSTFGLSNALIHRSPETEDLEAAACTHFTLRLIFISLFSLLLVSASVLLTQGVTTKVLLVLTVTTALTGLTDTGTAVLVRKVQLHRLAIVQALANVVSTPISVIAALHFKVWWILIIHEVINIIFGWVALYVWKPVWRIRLRWHMESVRYFLRFGGKSFFVGTCMMVLDRIDNIFTGKFLGKEALGLYSRAFSFSTYTRIIYAPIENVLAGAYAELKYDNARLSSAFDSVSSIVTWVSFALCGLLTVISKEFILLLLGDKWLPMLNAFRLLLFFMMFDPLRKILGYVFMAVGKPEALIPSLILRFIIMIGGLFTLGFSYGIEGVAMSAVIMLVAGNLMALLQLKKIIQFSILRLILGPTVCLCLATIGTMQFQLFLNGSHQGNFYSLMLKSTLYLVIFVTSFLTLYNRQFNMMRDLVVSKIRK